MKRQLVSVAFALGLFLLNSCGKEDDASSRDGSAQDQSTKGFSGKASTSTGKPAPSPGGDTGPLSAEETPTAEPAPAGPPPILETPASEPDPPARAPQDDSNASPAVVAFMSELKDKGVLRLATKLGRWEEGDQRDPLAMQEMFRDLNNLRDELETIDTDGLPAGLKKSTERFRNTAANLADHLEESPIPLDIMTAGEEVRREWFTEKMSEDPLFLQSMQDWGRTIGGLREDMTNSGAEWKNSLAEHGTGSPAE